MRLVIDIGHGGTKPSTGKLDVGAVASGVHEHDINVMIADAFARLLTTLHPWVELAGYTPQMWSHIKRASMAKASKADLVISVHCNASPTGDPREHGPLVFWDPAKISTAPYASRVAIASSTRGGEYLEAGKVKPMLSHQIKARLLDGEGKKHWTHRAYNVLTAYTNQGVDAILVELGYMTNPSELAWLTSTEGRTDAARILCAAFLRRINR